jgi:threonine/homoserine/homoserine lactone efflux protein
VPSLFHQLANSTLLLLGLLLLYLAYRSWKQQSKPRADSATPNWMSSIDSFSPGRSFGLGAVLAIANPKNLTLTLSAALIIAQSGLSISQTSIALAAFVAISSLTILVPVAYFLLAKTSADHILAGWKSWLVENNSAIQIYLYLIFGTLMAFIGLRGILNEMPY